jgi:hypothetical protein
MLIALIGIGFFIKGLLMLKREAEAPQYGAWPGIVTIVASILIGNAGGLQKILM